MSGSKRLLHIPENQEEDIGFDAIQVMNLEKKKESTRGSIAHRSHQKLCEPTVQTHLFMGQSCIKTK